MGLIEQKNQGIFWKNNQAQEMQRGWEFRPQVSGKWAPLPSKKHPFGVLAMKCLELLWRAMDDVLLKAGSPNYGIGEELIRLFLPQCYFIWRDLLHAWYIYIGVVSGVIAYKLQLLPSIHGMTGRYIYIYTVSEYKTRTNSHSSM